MPLNEQTQASLIEYEITSEWSRIFVPVGTEFIKVMNENIYPAPHVDILWNCPLPPEGSGPGEVFGPGIGMMLDKYLLRVGTMALSDQDPSLKGAMLAGMLNDGLNYTQGVWLYKVGTELFHVGDTEAGEDSFLEVPINGAFKNTPQT